MLPRTRRGRQVTFAAVVLTAGVAIAAVQLTAEPEKAISALPPAPTGLSAAVKDRTVTLTWDKSTDTQFKYFAVRRGTQSNPDTGTWTRLTPNYTEPTATDTRSTDGSYFYYVTQIDTAGQVSARSSVVKAVVPAPEPVPVPPADTNGGEPTPTTDGTVTFDSEIQAKGLAKYDSVIHREGITVVDDPLGVLTATGAVRKVIRMKTLNSYTGPTSNPRTQIETPETILQGDDVYKGYSVLLPTDTPTRVSGSSGDNFVSMGSIYGPPYAGSGDATLGSYGGDFAYGLKGNGKNTNWQYIWKATRSQMVGRWVDIVIRELIDTNGIVEVWANFGSGWAKQSLLGGVETWRGNLWSSSHNGGPNRDSLGVYYGHNQYPSMTAFFAEHRLGTSFEAVKPHTYE